MTVRTTTRIVAAASIVGFAVLCALRLPRRDAVLPHAVSPMPRCFVDGIGRDRGEVRLHSDYWGAAGVSVPLIRGSHALTSRTTLAIYPYLIPLTQGKIGFTCTGLCTESDALRAQVYSTMDSLAKEVQAVGSPLAMAFMEIPTPEPEPDPRDSGGRSWCRLLGPRDRDRLVGSLRTVATGEHAWAAVGRLLLVSLLLDTRRSDIQRLDDAEKLIAQLANSLTDLDETLVASTSWYAEAVRRLRHATEKQPPEPGYARGLLREYGLGPGDCRTTEEWVYDDEQFNR